MNDLGRPDEATASLLLALRFDDENYLANMCLARQFISLESSLSFASDEALKFAQKACDLTSNKDKRCLETLAGVHALRKEYGKAIKIQEKACEVSSINELAASKRLLSKYQKLQ